MKKWFPVGFLILLMLAALPALSETVLRTDRTEYALGEAVRVTLDAEQTFKYCRYSLLRDGQTVFSQKTNDKHREGWYLPQQPGEYVLSAAVTGTDKKKKTVSCAFTVKASAVPVETDALYSQKDGSWADDPYGKEELEKSGCAIFTLSNALHYLGYTGAETEPAALAARYGYCLIQGGTSNVRLITQAAKDYGFFTQSALVKEEGAVADLLKDGAVFSFAIVKGHIAFVCGLSEDGGKVRIVDSAPSATWERIKGGKLYRQESDGSFVALQDLSDLPGARYYLETQHYEGLSYWLDLAYVAKRGVRVMQPYWLQVRQERSVSAAQLVTFGTVVSSVRVSGQKEPILVSTLDLIWRHETDAPQAALVISKKAAILRDSGGAQVARVARGSLLPVISVTDSAVCVRYEGRMGYLSPEDAQVVSVPPESYQTGVVHINGKTTGKSNVGFRRNPLSNSTQIGYWPTGTTVYVLAEQDGYYLAEANGKRGWLLPKNVQLENENTVP